jgi:hypothetical protein
LKKEFFEIALPGNSLEASQNISAACPPLLNGSLGGVEWPYIAIKISIGGPEGPDREKVRWTRERR